MQKNYLKNYQGKTILISGSEGYIGSALVTALANINCQLILLDKLPRKKTWLPGHLKAKIKTINGDIALKKVWLNALPGVDYLFHLAALEYDRKHYNFRRDYRINALAVVDLLEICRKRHFNPKIIFSSSANVFGAVNKMPVDEKIPSVPNSLWSIHKYMAENYLRFYAQQYNIKTLILRLANVYGPTVNRQKLSSVVLNRIIINIMKGHQLTLYSNKECWRDFIYLSDVINAFLAAGTLSNLLFDGRFYVIGSGERKTIANILYFIANKVSKYTNKKTIIKTDNSTKLELLDQRNFIADINNFKLATNWQPQVFLNEGINKTIKALSKIE